MCANFHYLKTEFTDTQTTVQKTFRARFHETVDIKKCIGLFVCGLAKYSDKRVLNSSEYYIDWDYDVY